jgi:hypothetical protein
VIRYYIIATAIVVIFGSIVFAHRLAPPNLRISALPDCFDEQSRLSGPFTALEAKLPPAGDRIAPGTTLHVAVCTLLVRPRDIWVDRGSDRLRVSPDAALYRVDGRLVLTVRTGAQLEIRHY